MDLVDPPTCHGQPMRPIVAHNRIKERGFRPVRGADGAWTIHRPDGGPITPPA